MEGGAAAPPGNCPRQCPWNSALPPLPGSRPAPSTGLITLINRTSSTDLHIDPYPSFLMENSECAARGSRRVGLMVLILPQLCAGFPKSAIDSLQQHTEFF